jgi:hypothetical protein
MTTKISFEEFKKRRRPEEICINCGKHKEIYTHLNGEEDKPLCNACNMKLRRNSPGLKIGPRESAGKADSRAPPGRSSDR